MAQIPVPNFGQSVAQPAQAVNVPRMDVSSGIENFASQGQAIAEDYVKQQTAAKTSLALATATNSARDAHDEVARGLQDGSIPPDQAVAQLQSRIDTITATQTDGLPAPAAAMVKTQMISTTGDLSRSMAGTVFKYGQDETKATQDEFGRQLQQQAPQRGPANVSDTYDAIMDFTGASAGYTPSQIQAKKIAFRQNTTAGYYTDKGAALHAADDLDGITSTLNEVLGPAGEAMTPQQRAQVSNHLVGLQNHLLAQRQRDADAADRDRIARENAGADAYNAALKVVTEGAYLSPDAIADLSAKTAGTSLEKQTTALLAAQSQVAGFASLPAGARAAQLEHYRSEGANPAVGTTPESQRSIAMLTAVDSKINAAVNDDPWKAAQTYGVIVNARAMDMTNPDNALPLLDLRMQQIGKVEAWVGHKVSPLQPAEVEQLAHTLKGMSSAQAASTLSMVGGMVGDADRIAAVAKQLGDRDGDYGLVMAYAGDRTADGQLTGQKILEGALAIKNKTSQPDQAAQSGWKATIFNQIHGAFSSQSAENSAVDAAYKIAAANGGDVDAAVKAATGGIITHGLGKIPLPINMDESTFDKRLSQITPALLTTQAPDGKAYVGGAPIPLQQFTASLPTATLVHAGQGLYVVKAGTSFVTNQAGQRIVLRISQ